MPLHVLILGSAAGGGFPQWNCGCSQCNAVRLGTAGFLPRTQDCLAVSADGVQWFLLNASPDITHQLTRHPEFHPQRLRHSPISGVVLTNGDLDHVLGLFQLREAQPLSLYATARVHAGLNENVAMKTLQRFDGHLSPRPLHLDQPCELLTAAGEPSGLFVEAVPLPGKPPLHLTEKFAPSLEDNIALRVRTATSGYLVYASAISDVRVAGRAFDDCEALLLDGTFWSEEELPDLGVNMGPARTMAHQPVGGKLGSFEALRNARIPRRIFTHLNNTNPLLDASSRPRAEIEAGGWEVAHDGLRLVIE